ncbi:hypothetical protein HELRODRAFT_191579 [Helobdella robusta]|uniref:Ig-like domain-containing protein n=1 Tax=Helobdella robusta TaxID=6412 RepID=T1FT36_HELRO|nr:hypothetical protein HELRODRAFT_191579 [Helobdella robusta]ESO05066.1 hypothetical protein HELRODRAFT_191579 [Helobdella robusta]
MNGKLPTSAFMLVTSLAYVIFAQVDDSITYELADVGDDLTLKCALQLANNDQINWNNPKGKLIIANDKFVFGTNSSNPSAGSNNYNTMTITDLSLQDAGRYTCQASSDKSLKTIVVVVFDTVKVWVDPTQGLKVGDPMRINCTVTYSIEKLSTLAQRLTFVISVGNQQLTTMESSSPDTTASGTVNKWISYNTTATNEMKTNNITCLLQTDDNSYSQAGFGRANIPFAPTVSDIQVLNMQRSYQAKDVVQCSIISNPPSTVTWILNGTGLTNCIGSTSNNPGTISSGPGYSTLSFNCLGTQTWICTGRYQNTDGIMVNVNKTFTFSELNNSLVLDSNNNTVVPSGAVNNGKPSIIGKNEGVLSYAGTPHCYISINYLLQYYDDKKFLVDAVGIGVGVGVGVGVPLLIGLILLICCLSKRKSEAKDAKKKPPLKEQQKQPTKTQQQPQQPNPYKPKNATVSLQANPAFHAPPVLTQQMNPNGQPVTVGAPGFPDIGVKHLGGSGSIPQLNESYDNQAYQNTVSANNVKIDFGKAALGGVTNI